MATIRKPFQGVTNIIRFNRHFYLIALGGLLALLLLVPFLEDTFRFMIFGVVLLILFITLTSLVFSYYIYDFSGLYRMRWLDGLSVEKGNTIANIHAGFDETSELLKERFPLCRMQVLDFYDPEKHTEISVRRARKAYPPFPGTKTTGTAVLPFANESLDFIFLIFAAHEIRDPKERIAFFKELKRVLTPNGKIVVTEHLRDLPNFMAYTLGFFHFYSKSNWRSTFSDVGLKISSEEKCTPFITTFVLENDGTSA